MEPEGKSAVELDDERIDDILKPQGKSPDELDGERIEEPFDGKASASRSGAVGTHRSFSAQQKSRRYASLYTDPRGEDSLDQENRQGGDIPTQVGMEIFQLGMEAVPEGGSRREEGESFPSDEALCDEDGLSNVPMRHVVSGKGVPYADDVSSLHYQNMSVASYGDHRVGRESPRQQRNMNSKKSYIQHREKMNIKRYEKMGNNNHSNVNKSLDHKRQEPSPQRSKNKDEKMNVHHVRHEPRKYAIVEVDSGKSDDEDAKRKRKRCRHAVIIIFLVLFLGLVAFITVGVGFALNNTSSRAVETARDEETPGPIAANDGDEKDEWGERADSAVDLFDASMPSSFPSSMGPCIPVEVGIIFDEYSGETGWMLVEGNYYPEDPERNIIVWKSRFYTPSDYAKRADTFHKCFSQGYYTFVFTDKAGDHGEGLYIMSSQGKVIAMRAEKKSTEETFPFRLPYEEPKPNDSNGDGRDDRLGLLMPYDSSNMTEGVGCSNFRLVIATDSYGIETQWELFEGKDRFGTLIANGGPYGSRYTYVINYCLASQKEYALYMYDWDRRGLCCESGRGWYRVFSGDVVLRDSDGKFGEVEITQFTLPVDG